MPLMTSLEDMRRELHEKFERLKDNPSSIDRSLNPQMVNSLMWGQYWKSIAHLDQLLKDVINESEERHREMGFALCKKDEKYEPSRFCTGDYCTVAIENCPEPSKGRVAFHTHPAEPTGTHSKRDIDILLYDEKLDFSCIGYINPEGKKSIKCIRFDREAKEYREYFEARRRSIEFLNAHPLGLIFPKDRKEYGELKGKEDEAKKKLLERIEGFIRTF